MNFDEKDPGKNVRRNDRKSHLSIVGNRAITMHNRDLSVTAMHQVSEMIIHFAVPISDFTAYPERYCSMWHKTIGADIDGLKSMMERLEKLYSRIGEIEDEGD